MGHRARTMADLEIPQFDDVQDLTEEERRGIGRNLFDVSVCSEKSVDGRLKHPKEMPRWLDKSYQAARRNMH
jgi:hypothetical protein